MRPPIPVLAALTLLLGLACTASQPSPGVDPHPALDDPPELPFTGAEDALLFSDVRLPGGSHTALRVESGRIVAMGPQIDGEGAVVIDAQGRYAVAGFIDSHVHLAYLPVAEELAANGVAAVVDLAAPIEHIGVPQPLTVLSAGPMITATDGYPTQSWGRDGYGIECSEPSSCADMVSRLHAAGAALVKVPITHEPTLDDASLRAVVERAHELDLLVVAHALSDEAARRAAEADIDVLAHTPTETLSDATVQAWAGRVVVSTLVAFGASEASVDNLRRLHEAGATILYGTDLGNTRDARIDPAELQALSEAGLSPEQILAAGTSTPARLFGLETMGDLRVGAEASFLLTSTDPLQDPTTLAEPRLVVLRGSVL